MSMTPRESPCFVRPMVVSDLAVVGKLSEELGYAIGSEALRQQWGLLSEHPEHALFVACRDSTVLGWLHVHEQHRLESESFAEIGGLVVGTQARRLGLGRRLVARARAWARSRGLRALRVRSNVQRLESHAFYPAIGFRLLKTQQTYAAELEGDGS